MLLLIMIKLVTRALKVPVPKVVEVVQVLKQQQRHIHLSKSMPKGRMTVQRIKLNKLKKID